MRFDCDDCLSCLAAKNHEELGEKEIKGAQGKRHDGL